MNTDERHKNQCMKKVNLKIITLLIQMCHHISVAAGSVIILRSLHLRRLAYRPVSQQKWVYNGTNSRVSHQGSQFKYFFVFLDP